MTRRHGDRHPERFNLDFFFKTDTWASGLPSLPPLTSSMTETVEFTHGLCCSLTIFGRDRAPCFA